MTVRYRRERASQRGGIDAMNGPSAAQWDVLDCHFEYHARLVARFKEAGHIAVRQMWRTQINEGGAALTQFEREALIERHCELFGA